MKFSSRFSVGLFYPPSITSLNVPWRIYYVDPKENDCLRFLAIDNAKRNKSKFIISKYSRANEKRFSDEPPFSLIAHTNVDYGAKYADEDKRIIGEQVKEKIFQFLPTLPRDISHAKFHKWKYSQVLFRYSSCI